MLIRNLKISGVLSFGAKGIDLPLRPLNVLIGANGSGKSNFIEILNLLRYLPTRLDSPIMSSGGMGEWLYGGAAGFNIEPPLVKIEAVVEKLKGQVMGLRHSIVIRPNGDFPAVDDETIENEAVIGSDTEVRWFYRMNGGNGMLNERGADTDGGGEVRVLYRENLDSRASILSQMRDPDRFRAFDLLQRAYSGIHIYREWCFGPGTVARSAPQADAPIDHVGRRGENLAAVIASMGSKRRNEFVTVLRSLYDNIEGVRVAPGPGGGLKLYVEESSGMEISANRLSDGTLRFLFLLAILLDPAPPRLIVIEEPELGLHPDVIPKIAELLVNASKRTQLVVTTHSRMLIDALGDDPDSVIVCEKHDGQTTLERLDAERMKVWLEKYSLGELWSKGEIGGNRW
jgi:predicted ATPase